jgi:3-oxoacyl-[acyl-carrier-protein] synthase I
LQPLKISHTTLTNALGTGVAAILEALRSRRSGLAPCVFDTVDLDTWVGMVTGLDDFRVRDDLAAYDCRSNRLAQLALEQDSFAGAVAAAREKYGAARIGVFLGTSTSGLLQTELAYRRRDPQTGALPPDFHYAETQNTYSLADFVRRYLGLHGSSLVVSSACSSTAKVFGNALRMMAAGVCDAAVVGGVDTLCLTTLYGFNSLGLVSASPCRPYDVERNGISIGEGAGFALLEKTAMPDSAESILFLGRAPDLPCSAPWILPGCSLPTSITSTCTAPRPRQTTRARAKPSRRCLATNCHAVPPKAGPGICWARRASPKQSFPCWRSSTALSRAAWARSKSTRL